MIVGVAFCPHPPALVPKLGLGTGPELDKLRSACTAAVRRVADLRPDRIALLGAGPMSAVFAPMATGTLGPYGLPGTVSLGAPTDTWSAPAAPTLPLSLTIGAHVMVDAGVARANVTGFSIGSDFAASDVAAELSLLCRSGSVGLLVFGDGSARRTVRAPGYLDARAVDYDAFVLGALAGADPTALAGLDLELGAELLAAGAPAWRAAGALLDGCSYDAALDYDADPFGVAYFVATWMARVEA